MPKTCSLCIHAQREEIDSALIAGASYRNMTERFGTSLAAISRHKNHAAQAIRRASEGREERVGENLLEEMRRVQRKAWELLARTESEGDHRGSIVALREVRECLESLGEMLAKANEANGKSADQEKCDFSVLSDDELWALEALIAKAANRPPWKPELLVPETLARIAKGRGPDGAAFQIEACRYRER